jgi:hypothetical protein
MSESSVSSQRTGRKFLVPLIWFALVTAGSFLPLNWKVFFHLEGRFHVMLHFVCFVLSAFVIFGMNPSRARFTGGSAALFAFALALEMLQRSMFPIRFEWRDLFADTGGTVTAMMLIALSQLARNSDG